MVLTGLFAAIGLVCLVYTIGVYVVVERYCQMEVLAKVRSPDGARAIVHMINFCPEEETIKHQLSVGDAVGILNSESKIADFWETEHQEPSIWHVQFPVLKIRWDLQDEIVVSYPSSMGEPHIPENLGGVKILLKVY